MILPVLLLNELPSYEMSFARLKHLQPPEVLASVKPCIGFVLRGFDLQLIAPRV